MKATVKNKIHCIIGIDEAGRGPLAGPVVVAGVKIAMDDPKYVARLFRGIKDSKKLTALQRDRWFEVLTAHPHMQYAVAIISSKTIDRINIAQATHHGAHMVCKKLLAEKEVADAHVLLDGSLKLPKEFYHDVIIKGDERVPIIAAASIIAKVTRDRIMFRLHKKYPQYGFDVHKGYGTRQHYAAIARYGLLGAHRRSFRLT